ncbi:hypothetical protein ACE38W_14715 [Chitinophaga sp. Hz27]|uniref:hypothetical protein n=1 Tax=Chitinophaga sp. Hz27 TaxID=3347169 RepID=UPI0035D753AB
MKQIVKWLASVTGVEADIREHEVKKLKSELIIIADKYSGENKYQLITEIIKTVATGIKRDETGNLVLAKAMDTLCSNEDFFKKTKPAG